MIGRYDRYKHYRRPPYPKAYPPMSMQQRAAQFVSFRALTGFEVLIEEMVGYNEKLY